MTLDNDASGTDRRGVDSTVTQRKDVASTGNRGRGRHGYRDQLSVARVFWTTIEFFERQLAR